MSIVSCARSPWEPDAWAYFKVTRQLHSNFIRGSTRLRAGVSCAKPRLATSSAVLSDHCLDIQPGSWTLSTTRARHRTRFARSDVARPRPLARPCDLITSRYSRALACAAQRSAHRSRRAARCPSLAPRSALPRAPSAPTLLLRYVRAGGSGSDAPQPTPSPGAAHTKPVGLH